MKSNLIELDKKKYHALTHMLEKNYYYFMLKLYDI